MSIKFTVKEPGETIMAQVFGSEEFLNQLRLTLLNEGAQSLLAFSQRFTNGRRMIISLYDMIRNWQEIKLGHGYEPDKGVCLVISSERLR